MRDKEELKLKNVLTIAGSDSSGGAGIQADIKAFSANGGYGMSVITSVTAQNTKSVDKVFDIPADIVKAQIDAVFSDINVDGVKIGMLSNAEIANVVADAMEVYKPKILIIDPVMVSTSGAKLLSDDAFEVITTRLFPLATMVTPNLPEAEYIYGKKISTVQEMGTAAQAIGTLGPDYVLIKGGHLLDDATDLLYNGRTMTIFDRKRITTPNTHGTGCSISSAICVNLAKGMDAVLAVGEAKKYVATGIEHGLSIGAGNGPIHHFYDLWKTSNPNVEAEFKIVEKE